jgi:hypothetical protein
LANVGTGQAQGSYTYRHASVTRLSDPAGDDALSPDHVRLDDLGLNRNGKPIRALMIDSQFVVPAGFEAFGVRPRTHHRQRWADCFYADGHASSLANTNGRFTVTLDTYQAMKSAFDLLLQTLERADEMH